LIHRIFPQATEMEKMFDRLQNLEYESNLDWIGVCS